MENSFLKTLRIWVKHLPGGAFPETLAPGDMFNLFLSGHGDLMKMSAEERKELTPEELADMIGVRQKEEHPLKSLGPDEAEEFSINALFGSLFIDSLEESGSELLYSGNGVRLGEGNREIFRYRMPDSLYWRVIYGDLHAGDFP